MPILRPDSCTGAGPKLTVGTGERVRPGSIVANNTAMYTPSCSAARSDGSGNLQWPSGSLCTSKPLVADPRLGTLGDHGGDAETLVPASGSPARGIASGCPPTDQRGNARPEPCTAGAVEPP